MRAREPLPVPSLAGFQETSAVVGAAPSSFRLPSQTLPYLSTVVREGLAGLRFGAVRYSPRIWPLLTSTRATVPGCVPPPSRERAIFTNGYGVIVLFS